MSVTNSRLGFGVRRGLVGVSAVALLGMVSLVATLPARAGMPSRGGAGHSLVNPPGSKAAPLPGTMNEFRLITADSLASACAYPDFAGKSEPILAPDISMDCDDVIGGADHRVAAIGGRTKESAHLSIAGVPDGSKLVEAFLYWAVLRDELSVEGNVLTFEGLEVEGEVVGKASQPCWDTTTELVAFRAPITDRLSAPFNGDYRVGGFPRSEEVPTGISPWALEAQAKPYFEGVAAVVVYLNESVPWDSVVAIHDGALDLFTELTVNHELSSAFPTRGEDEGMIHFSRIGVDGQHLRDDEATVELNTWLGPNAETLIRGSKSQYDRSSDFTGATGGTVTQLCDAESNELPMEGDLLNLSGKTAYQVRYDLDLDFLAPVAYPEGNGVPEQEEVLVDCITVLAHAITIR